MKDRTKKLLLLIIKDYIEFGIPVGSKKLISKYDLQWSPALIRTEMSSLEKEGYLEKAHISGGRIPTNLAYKFYASELKPFDQTKVLNERELTLEIDKIFDNRDLKIDEIIDETIKILASTTSMLTITKEKINKDELLANISLHQTQEKTAILLIVTNTNRVINKTIEIKDNEIEALSISIEVFNQRLKGTKIIEIQDKALLLKELISDKVKDTEFDFKNLVQLIFNNVIEKGKTQHRFGNIIEYDEINKSKELLQKMIDIIEENTVWDLIKTPKEKDSKNPNITIGFKGSEDLVIINKDINLRGETHSIALLGPKRVDYEKISHTLDWISMKLESL